MLVYLASVFLGEAPATLSNKSVPLVSIVQPRADDWKAFLSPINNISTQLAAAIRRVASILPIIFVSAAVLDFCRKRRNIC